MKLYRDGFGNTATIDFKMGYPYNGSPEKVPEYVLTCRAEYDDNKIYFLSIYETEGDAIETLKSFSCGTFKQVEE